MGIMERAEADRITKQKADAFDNMQRERELALLSQRAYDKGASESEASLARMLYESQIAAQQPLDLVDLNPEGFSADPADFRPDPAEINLGLASQLGGR